VLRTLWLTFAQPFNKEVSCIAGQPHDLEAKQLGAGLKKQLPANWE
jgi:hypothetical protein